jgi:hypothetical protein
MHKKEMQEIVNDLLELHSWRQPLKETQTKHKTGINLLTKTITGITEEKIEELLKEKSDWFKQRITKENINKKDLQEAKIIIIIQGCTETIKVTYKEKEFKQSKAW